MDQLLQATNPEETRSVLSSLAQGRQEQPWYSKMMFGNTGPTGIERTAGGGLLQQALENPLDRQQKQATLEATNALTTQRLQDKPISVNASKWKLKTPAQRQAEIEREQKEGEADLAIKEANVEDIETKRTREKWKFSRDKKIEANDELLRAGKVDELTHKRKTWKIESQYADAKAKADQANRDESVRKLRYTRANKDITPALRRLNAELKSLEKNRTALVKVYSETFDEDARSQLEQVSDEIDQKTTQQSEFLQLDQLASTVEEYNDMLNEKGSDDYNDNIRQLKMLSMNTSMGAREKIAKLQQILQAIEAEMIGK